MEKVKVIFRKDGKSGDILAFFPGAPANFGSILCWDAVSGHGEADLEYYWSTKSVKQEEYRSIAELYSTAYDVALDIRKRLRYDDQVEAWKHWPRRRKPQ